MTPRVKTCGHACDFVWPGKEHEPACACCECLHTDRSAMTIYIDGLGEQPCPHWQFYCRACIGRCAPDNATIWNAAQRQRVPVFELGAGRTLAHHIVPMPPRPAAPAKEPDWVTTAKQTLKELKGEPDGPDVSPTWPTCQHCTFVNEASMVRCEMCGMAPSEVTQNHAFEELVRMGFKPRAAREAARAVVSDDAAVRLDAAVQRAVERLLAAAQLPTKPLPQRVQAELRPKDVHATPRPKPPRAKGKARVNRADLDGLNRALNRPSLNRSDLDAPPLQPGVAEAGAETVGQAAARGAEFEQPSETWAVGECAGCSEIHVEVGAAVGNATGERYCKACWDEYLGGDYFSGAHGYRGDGTVVVEAAEAAEAAAAAEVAAAAEAAEVAAAAEAAEAAAALTADGWTELEDPRGAQGEVWDESVVTLAMLGAPAAPLDEPRGGGEAPPLSRHRLARGLRSVPLYVPRPAEAEAEAEAEAWELLSLAGSEACTEYTQCSEHTEAFSEAATEAWETESMSESLGHAPAAAPAGAAPAEPLESVAEGAACTSWAARVCAPGAMPARPTPARQKSARAAPNGAAPKPSAPNVKAQQQRQHAHTRLPRWSEVAFVYG